VDITAGSTFTCGLRRDGRVLCWGNHPTDIPETAFGSIDAGDAHVCGLTTSDIYVEQIDMAGVIAGSSKMNTDCWGEGELYWETSGHGQSYVPVETWSGGEMGRLQQVSAGSGHTCGLKEDGSLECWGADGFGESTPPGWRYSAVSAGGYHSCGIVKRTKATPDPFVECWGCGWSARDPEMRDGQLVVVRYQKDNKGMFGGQSIDLGQCTTLHGDWTQIDAGHLHSCGIQADGNLYCWGDNSSGQCGPFENFDGTFSPEYTNMALGLLARPRATKVLNPYLDSVAEEKYRTADAKAANLYKMAVDKLAEGDRAEARQSLKQLVSLDNAEDYEEEASLLLARTFFDEETHSEFLQAIDRWVQDHPGSRLLPRAEVTRGRGYLMASSVFRGDEAFASGEAARRLWQAEATLRGVLTFHWEDKRSAGEALYGLYWVYLNLGLEEAALEICDEMASAHPSHYLTVNLLSKAAGRAWVRQDYEAAARLYQRLLDEFGEVVNTEAVDAFLTSVRLVGQPAPAMDPDHWIGSSVDITRSSSEHTLLLYWNESCDHSRAAMPRVAEIAGTYTPQEIRIVGWTRHLWRQTDETVSGYLKEQGIEFPNAVFPEESTAHQPYGFGGTPAAALIAPSGIVVWRGHPSTLEDDLLRELLYPGT